MFEFILKVFISLLILLSDNPSIQNNYRQQLQIKHTLQATQ